MARRERLEVIRDILCLIRDKGNKIKPTPLLRFSNLSPKSFAGYYEELLAKELIRELQDKKGKKSISLTDKGFRYLERYRDITTFIEEFEL